MFRLQTCRNIRISLAFLCCYKVFVYEHGLYKDPWRVQKGGITSRFTASYTILLLSMSEGYIIYEPCMEHRQYVYRLKVIDERSLWMCSWCLLDQRNGSMTTKFEKSILVSTTSTPPSVMKTSNIALEELLVLWGYPRIKPFFNVFVWAELLISQTMCHGNDK